MNPSLIWRDVFSSSFVYMPKVRKINFQIIEVQLVQRIEKGKGLNAYFFVVENKVFLFRSSLYFNLLGIEAG